MYRDDKDALRDRVHVLEQELGEARGQLDALRETLRVRDERYEALMVEADQLRASLRGKGLDVRPIQKLLISVTPVFMLLSGGLFIVCLLKAVENPAAWIAGGVGLALVVVVLRWLYTGKFDE